MLAMGMMLGGKPTFRVELNSNQDQWEIVNDAPQLLVAYPITLYLTVAPGVAITSTSSFDAGISFFGLPNGSDVYLINNGTINGASGAGVKATTGYGVNANWNGGRLFITNASGGSPQEHSLTESGMRSTWREVPNQACSGSLALHGSPARCSHEACSDRQACGDRLHRRHPLAGSPSGCVE